MISVQRPYVLLLLFLVIPVVIYSVVRFKSVAASVGKIYFDFSTKRNSYSDFLRSFLLKIFFRTAACVFIIFALAGFSWGSQGVPLQKTGDAVSLVFDISYSMNAKDCPQGLTRLEAAKEYAYALIGRMEESEISVVLAKGDGVIAVPLTQDMASVFSMLENLSPKLMTAQGSSLGKGILAAIQSFPANMPHKSHIWIFTDGDETDGTLVSALEDAARFGFSVTIIGFGSSKDIEILAGDGKTKVKTSLKAEKMMDASSFVNQKYSVLRNRKSQAKNCVTYISADSSGSATAILESLSGKLGAGESYEMQPILRHGIFILLAIICFALSYLVSEFDFFSNSKRIKSSFVTIILACLVFSSCKSGKASVLYGTWEWYEKNYQAANADFLRAYTKSLSTQDKVLSQYASFALASTYLMQEEYEASLARLGQIPDNADKHLKSAKFYNEGIIASRKGDYDTATECFKKAILADSSNINAKINLEFTHQNIEKRSSKSAQSEMTAVNIEKNGQTLSNAVFTLIQQEEQKQWKKLQANTKESSSVDY